MPSGNGTRSRLRGRLKSTVSPVFVSMLARMRVSGRIPVRVGPASLPIIRTFTRGTFAHGSTCFGLGAGPVDFFGAVKTLVTRSRWINA